MPRLLFDTDKLDLNLDKPFIDTKGIEAINPHRFEFRLID